MKSFLAVVTLAFVGLVAPLRAQEQKSAAQPTNSPTNGAATAPAVVITAESTPLELARAAFQAQGGEKFRNLQNVVMRGSVQLYPPNSVQSIPGSFSLVTAGPRLRMEIDARPAIVFKQIYDGQESYSSMPNVQMPPLTKFGLGALARFDQTGYQITALPNKKKQRAFRIVDPDGYTTDFFIDPVNGRVMSFLIYFQGLTLGTEHSKFKEIEGVLFPSSFSQKFEMPMGAFFAEFSVKDVKINQQLAEDAFAIPR
ncbi:MAG TPA: hypothetical protein VFS76_02990 [Pyrinomonadaceae bacterium]|nr:hypothetical protein [Pyrinomonadaceae bacterium]